MRPFELLVCRSGLRPVSVCQGLSSAFHWTMSTKDRIDIEALLPTVDVRDWLILEIQLLTRLISSPRTSCRIGRSDGYEY